MQRGRPTLRAVKRGHCILQAGLSNSGKNGAPRDPPRSALALGFLARYARIVLSRAPVAQLDRVRLRRKPEGQGLC